MEAGPLANNFTVGAWVDHFVGRNTGELVRGGIADAVTTGLGAVHAHLSQFGENVRHFGQVWPVVLDILTGTDVAVAFIVMTGDMGQLAQLRGVHHAVGHVDTQHRRQALYIQAVLQAQGQELFGFQVTGEEAFGLVAKLGDTLAQNAVVVLIVDIHGARYLLPG